MSKYAEKQVQILADFVIANMTLVAEAPAGSETAGLMGTHNAQLSDIAFRIASEQAIFERDKVRVLA